MSECFFFILSSKDFYGLLKENHFWILEFFEAGYLIYS